VEDITAISALSVSATKKVVFIATPVSSTVGGKSLDGRHVAEVTPPSPTMAFQMVAQDPPPLAIFAPGFRWTVNGPHHWHRTLRIRCTTWE
jgi:hypothetical protein